MAMRRLFVRSLVFDDGFVNEHYRNLVSDGIKAVAGDAFEPTVIRFEFYFRPAGRTDKYFEEIRADSHEGIHKFSRSRAV